MPLNAKCKAAMDRYGGGFDNPVFASCFDPKRAFIYALVMQRIDHHLRRRTQQRCKGTAGNDVESMLVGILKVATKP
nr:hypothetical protein [Roseobacter sp. H9]